MKEILATLSQYPIKTRLSLTGPMIVARDLAHAKLRERLEQGEGLPDYFKNHPVYYAGPAKTPDGYASGAFGPTTAGRMDSFVDQFQAAGRLDGDAGQGQPLGRGARGLPEARRLLSRLDRRRRRRTSPSTASRRSRPWNIPSSAWRRSGASRSRISRPSSSSTTRATILMIQGCGSGVGRGPERKAEG